VGLCGVCGNWNRGGFGRGIRECSVWNLARFESDTTGIDTMAKVSPFKFLQEVRQEVAKITWPSRRETTITTVMVFAFAFVAGLFFLVADQVIRMTVTFVLGIGS
jgi:preprotein translocase subunit SecE